MNQHEIIQDQLAEHDRNAVRSHYDDMLQPAPGRVEQWKCECGWTGTNVLVFDPAVDSPATVVNLCPACKDPARKQGV